jgi:regulatory protein
MCFDSGVMLPSRSGNAQRRHTDGHPIRRLTPRRLRPPVSPPPSPHAYQIAVRLLARRDLSTVQLRERLTRREFPSSEINAAIARLTRERVVDDERMALGRARLAVEIKFRGQRRTRLEIEALGIDRETARRAVATVFDEVDEDTVLERAIAKRLTGTIHDQAHFRRLYQALLRQGFPPDRVAAALVSRAGRDTTFMEE